MSAILMLIAVVVFLMVTTSGGPLISTNPRPQFAWEGRLVSLNVSATGTPPFTYQWQFNGGDLAQGTNRILSIPRVNLTNNGDYRVIVSDTTGVTTSKVAQLLVRGWPMPTGPRVSELAWLDTEMQSVLLNRGIPGGSLAVVKDGRLVFARGYGWANVEGNEPFYPDTTGRIASLSKMIVTVGLMRMVEEGKLTLDTLVFPLLNLEPSTYPEATNDSRLTNITVRHLLSHTAGWNYTRARNPEGGIAFDPPFWPERSAKDLNVPAPVSPTDLVRWVMGKPLQTNPGNERFYSNIGFVIAGRVAEKISGITFEATAREFLAQAGITGIRLGGNTLADRRRGEAVYYFHPDPAAEAFLLEGNEPKPVDFSIPYAYPVTMLDSAGGLIASAIDYARFMTAIDGEPTYPDLLGTNSLRTMASPSAKLGWDYVNSPNPQSGIWYKTGALYGCNAWAVKWQNGVIFVYVLNAYANGGRDIYDRITARIGNVRWPTNDLFAASLSYDAWCAKHFSSGELLDPAISGEQSDPDRDGIPNLSEYGHGENPRAANEAARISANVLKIDAENVLELNFRRLLLAHELDYTLEDSSDLDHWSSIVTPEAGPPVLNANGTITASLKIGALRAPAARFFRVRISRK